MINWFIALAIAAICVIAYLRYTKHKPQTSHSISSPAVQPPAPQPSDESGLAFIDLETTGLDPAIHRVTEVCVYIVTNGSTTARGYNSLANAGVAVPSHITDLTGITNEMLSTAPPISDVIAKLLDIIGNKPVLAYNAKFDIGFLRAEAKRIGRDFNNDSICVMEMVKEQHPNLGRYRLQDMCAAFDIQVGAENNTGPHRAAFDAECAVHLYVALTTNQQPTAPAKADYPERRMDYDRLPAYHAVRASAASAFQQAKAVEKTDTTAAAHGYNEALGLYIKAAGMPIWSVPKGSSEVTTSQTGDIECLNRLTMCLCKLGRAAEANQAANEYFDVCTADATLKAADAIRKRIDKAAAKAAN